MAIPTPMVIGAIQAVVRFGGRLDDIRAVKEAATGLPFALPPGPPDLVPHLSGLIEFFETDQGGMVLVAGDLTELYDEFHQDPDPFGLSMLEARRALFPAYFEASGIVPGVFGDPDNEEPILVLEPDARLARYLVESHRLSRNPAFTRIVFSAADTLLEFGAENAQVFTAHPQTQALLKTFLDEFAGNVDLDDQSLDVVFKRLLGATVAAAADHPGGLAEKPSLGPLLSALANIRTEFDADFVERIVSVNGFEKLIGTYLTHVGNDPGFITKNEVLSDVLGDVLKKVGSEFPALLDDPRAFTGVLEVALTSSADHVPALLEGRLEGQPLLAVVLESVSDAVGQAASQHALFASVANGELYSEIYRTSLSAIAANPSVVASGAGADDLVGGLVSSLASTLAEDGLHEALDRDTVRKLGIDVLGALAEHPHVLIGNSEFAGKVVQASLEAGVLVLGSGSDPDHLLIVVEAAIEAAGDNLALVQMDDRLRAVLVALAGGLADDGLSSSLTPEGRTLLLLDTLEAVAMNPTMWSGFDEQDLVQPLVEAVVSGLKTDPTGLLSGPVLVEAVSGILVESARRGRGLLDGAVMPAVLSQLIAAALERAQNEIGRSVDGATLPEFLRGVVGAFLKEPVDLDDSAAVETLLESVLETV